MPRTRDRGSKKPAGTPWVSSRLHWPGLRATLAAESMATMPLASIMYVRFPLAKVAFVAAMLAASSQNFKTTRPKRGKNAK